MVQVFMPPFDCQAIFFSPHADHANPATPSVNPRKAKVSGLPRPHFSRFAAACREPINRVLFKMLSVFLKLDFKNRLLAPQKVRDVSGHPVNSLYAAASSQPAS